MRGGVYSLHTSVDPSELFLENRITKYWPVPTNAASCDARAIVLQESFSFRCAKFVRSSVESSGPSRKTNPLPRRECTTDCCYKTSDDFYCLGRTLEVKCRPALLGLETSCRNKLATIKLRT